MIHHLRRLALIPILGTLGLSGPSGTAMRSPLSASHPTASFFAARPTNEGPRERVIFTFQGRGGNLPFGGLITDATGALYGTTLETNDFGESGTVFELKPAGSGYTKHMLHRFSNIPDGSGPAGSLIADATGALYGVTVFGGSGCGTVFKLTPSGHRAYMEEILLRFNQRDGCNPNGSLIADAAGTLYGTTYIGQRNGHSDVGLVFSLTPSASGYEERVLYRFKGGTDGAYPAAGLIAGAGGTLYGTTGSGGFGGSGCLGGGCGTVFKLTPTGSGYAESVLYRFQG